MMLGQQKAQEGYPSTQMRYEKYGTEYTSEWMPSKSCDMKFLAGRPTKVTMYGSSQEHEKMPSTLAEQYIID